MTEKKKRVECPECGAGLNVSASITAVGMRLFEDGFDIHDADSYEIDSVYVEWCPVCRLQFTTESFNANGPVEISVTGEDES